MTIIPRPDPVGEERKGIRYSDYPDLAKFLLPTRREIDNPFNNLDDSPMFQKQVRYIELNTDELKTRCQKLHKGSKKYMDGLGEACSIDFVFADALEAFGGGQDDHVSSSIGGAIISKFVSAFREIESFKELLRTQVEHLLVDRLTQFLSDDLQATKDARKKLDKDTYAYDQAREKVASLRKSTRDEVVTESEEGYDLLSQLEPFIHQVLTYAQQSKEQATVEQDRLAKRVQEYRAQAEMKEAVPTSFGHHSVNGVGLSSDKNIDAIMKSTTKGTVQTIKQGYLLKRSSSLRADWKRRFFVLDSRGNLYYYRIFPNKPVGSQSTNSLTSTEQYSRVFGRFRSRHFRAASHDDENPECHTVDLRTSTIKADDEDSDLRLCFRIISPMKTYTLQAESEGDRIDWMNKITGVIASLLNQTHFNRDQLGSALDTVGEECAASQVDNMGSILDNTNINPEDCVCNILREIPGNDLCAECSAPEPDWASLNLGILMCIECSGVHRNLGVHISKVRSINLDVKVWEPTVMDLFRNLGNTYCNSIWENPLHTNSSEDGSNALAVNKPSPGDANQQREKYIIAKYVEKQLITREETNSDTPSYATRIWKATESNNIREVYRLIATSFINIINTTYDEVAGADLFHNLHEHDPAKGAEKTNPLACKKMKDISKPESCLEGCTLLHLACDLGYEVMLELLLQSGADINRSDYHGRTPLHHCIFSGNNKLAKYMIRRGADASIKDGGGRGALERAMETGAITDDELLIMLSEAK
ncbi:hypothetical protein M8C21_029414 [Ambrosia artemisiifolia]|uniref:Uncharacterized protein n=1 Tax=Ambrosia artemisiifolia TaxID=4212 RepID=A0AAD5CSR8_AMBAR|nr:hypothetical protein M8C21_029414 [Ambrosia artemisiifolia]